jgi:hypothetical protein
VEVRQLDRVEEVGDLCSVRIFFSRMISMMPFPLL